MRVALIEWTQGGHHDIYLKTAASALAGAGHEVWIVHPDPGAIRDAIVAAEPELAHRLKNLQLEPTSLTKSTRAQLKFPAKWMTLRNGLRKIEADGKQIDLVFFMYLDEFLVSLIPSNWLDVAFRYPWAGIYMQPLFRFLDSPVGRRPEFLRRDHLLRSRQFRGAMPLDVAAVPWLTTRFRRHFVGVPEFGNIAAPDREGPLVKELLTFADGRPIIGTFGALSKRKGVLTLLRAAPLLADLNCVFALAGQLSPETFSAEELTELKLAVEGPGDRCWYRPEKIAGDAEFSGLVSVSQVCYLAYIDWAFGGALQSVAAQFDIPTVVGNLGVMPEEAAKYGTGVSIDPTSPTEAANAVRRLLSEKLPSEAFAAFRADHSIEIFKCDLCEFVEHCGSPIRGGT